MIDTKKNRFNFEDSDQHSFQILRYEIGEKIESKLFHFFRAMPDPPPETTSFQSQSV